MSDVGCELFLSQLVGQAFPAAATSAATEKEKLTWLPHIDLNFGSSEQYSGIWKLPSSP